MNRMNSDIHSAEVTYLEAYGGGTNGRASSHAAGSPECSVRQLFARPAPEGVAVVGVLPGEGIGPEVIDAALQVLRAVERASPIRFDVRVGGTIGLASERECHRPLSR